MNTFGFMVCLWIVPRTESGMTQPAVETPESVFGLIAALANWSFPHYFIDSIIIWLSILFVLYIIRMHELYYLNRITGCGNYFFFLRGRTRWAICGLA